MNGGPTRRLNVALKIALLSWVITIVSLVIFVAAIVPAQRRTFEESMASKARGLSASLQDVIAGAAVTEDYSLIVDHCRQVLQGDDSIVYIVVTQNDGFSLIQESDGGRPGFRREPKWRQAVLDAFWHPAERRPTSRIGVVPLFGRRVFHDSRPFDYTGIQWGWVHVGLSLDAYDQSVAAVYRRTGFLALGCTVVSLLLSVLYARRIVRPIQSLEGVLHRVSTGDLSAHADIRTGDELESLADSVNVMTGTLLQRDRILECVRHAAQRFLLAPGWAEVIGEVMARLGQAAGVNRVDLFELREEEAGRPMGWHRFEWVAAGTGAMLEGAAPAGRPWPGRDLETEGHKGKGLMTGPVADLEPAMRAFLEPLGLTSLAAAPIVVEGACLGMLSLGQCGGCRPWTESEKDSLRVVADMLGATIARHRVREALEEAKATLEQRVLTRTFELQEQMAAKEKIHADLAEAQHRLTEASRKAGMAEVATGVLHNVGNILNSVNVSATLIGERLGASEVSSLVQLGALLREHEGGMDAFLATDPRGRHVPRFIVQVADHLQAENRRLLEEQNNLRRNLEHIKEVVNMQQSYATVSGFREQVGVAELVEDALRLNSPAFVRTGIQVARSFASLPQAVLDKHRIIQILVNLVQNATNALADSGRADKVLSVAIAPAGPDRFTVTVADNGVGIPAENLVRIFSHGFSTRARGHGFGLHSAALGAREMGGELRVHSGGPGLGSTFTLELPLVFQETDPGVGT